MLELLAASARAGCVARRLLHACLSTRHRRALLRLGALLLLLLLLLCLLREAPHCNVAPNAVEEEEDPELRNMTRRFWVALSLSVPVLLLAMLCTVHDFHFIN